MTLAERNWMSRPRLEAPEHRAPLTMTSTSTASPAVDRAIVNALQLPSPRGLVSAAGTSYRSGSLLRGIEAHLTIGTATSIALMSRPRGVEHAPASSGRARDR